MLKAWDVALCLKCLSSRNVYNLIHMMLCQNAIMMISQNSSDFGLLVCLEQNLNEIYIWRKLKYATLRS